MSRETISREEAIRAFVRETYGPRGTLRLHRAALGWDLLRAPLNLLLAPVFLVVKLSGLAARALGRDRAGRWLLSRRILVETRVARLLRVRLTSFLGGLDLDASDAAIDQAIKDYTGVRGAVAEIVTMLVLLVTGFVLFRSATPGVVSLATPLAAMRAEVEAIARFPLGGFLGRAWYAVFPVAVPVWQVLATGAALAVAAALVTTFAGILADPVQVALGTHKRRLARMIARLEQGAEEGLAREHLAARAGDLSDLALTLWRSLKG